MAKQRNYSTEFKRQVVLEHLAGETLYGLSKRHDVSRSAAPMHFREYPLLNTPHLVIVLLTEATRGAASVEDCATRLWAILEAADEHPPVGVDEVLRRMDILRRNLTEAQLVAPADGERFAITPRGRDALKQHPAGFDRFSCPAAALLPSIRAVA